MLTVNLNHEYWKDYVAAATGESVEAMPREMVEGFIREVMVEYTARTEADYNTTNFTPRGVSHVQGGTDRERQDLDASLEDVIKRWKADSPE